jgi:maleylacetoacetate isomerase
MKLYTYFRSSAAYRLRIALALKGLSYEPVYIHLRKKEHKAADYVRLNPQGLVPTLIDDDGSVLTQSLAVIEYLDETRPEPPLMPQDPHGRARVRALAQLMACEIHPVNNLRILQYLKNELGLDDAARDTWYRHWVTEGFNALEVMLDDSATGQFCHGDRPGLADICLVPQVYNAERFGTDMAAYPRIKAINYAMLALPALDGTAPGDQPDADG